MKKSRAVALSAIATAFAVICLLIGALTGLFDYSAVFMASMCTMIPLTKKLPLGAFMCFLATSLISLSFASVDLPMYLIFVLFFGLHPTVNYLIREKQLNKLLFWFIKAVWFVGSLLLIYTFFANFLLEDSILENAVFQKYSYPILSFILVVFFAIYDPIMIFFQKQLDRIVQRLKL